MYLLHRDERDMIKLTDFTGNRPPYAILSHTWGPDEEEVKFKDVQKNRGHNKAGYKKIGFCLDQAKRDGLYYCWDSDKCYVYLADVPECSFRSSRWFTRGWTLQELIAPTVVEFYSSEGIILGDRLSLLQDIHERTQIPTKLLEGRSVIAEYSIDQRISWIRRRQTKREEDMVYALLGLVGVSMPPEYGEGREAAEDRLRKRVDESHTSKNQPRAVLDAVNQQDLFSLPFALPGAPISTSFTGRRDEMAQLEKALPPGVSRETVILHGLGGVGKTQLAIEYAKVHQYDYSAILWMDGRDESSIEQSFGDLLKRASQAHPSTKSLKIEAGCQDLDEATSVLKDWLNTSGNSRWLLVIDNLDEPHIPGVVEGLYDVRDFLPTTLHGHVLITTRSAQLRIGRQVHLQKIQNEKECLNILALNSQRDDLGEETGIYDLIKRLDGLPLALSIAGAYLGLVSVSVSEYLEQYEQSWLELQRSSPALPEHAGRSLETTWEISYRLVVKKNPEAGELLKLWAFFASNDLWYELIAAGRGDGPHWLQTITSNKLAFDKHMRLLCNHGLVEAQRSPSGYGMHKCLHDWVCEVLGKEDQNRGERFALVCISALQESKISTKVWQTVQRLEKHAKHLMKSLERSKDISHLEDGLLAIGLLYITLRKISEASAVLKRLISSQEKSHGLAHESTLQTGTMLYGLYLFSGRNEEAEAHRVRAIAECEALLGPNHDAVLEANLWFGKVQLNSGNNDQARAILLPTLERARSSLSANHPTMRRAMIMVGQLSCKVGDLPRAHQAMNYLAERAEPSSPTESRELLDLLLGSSQLLQNLGELEKAERMVKGILQFLEERPDIELWKGSCIDQLATLYEKQDRWVEALKAREYMVAESMEFYGPEHPTTFASRMFLARVSILSGSSKKGKAEAKEIVEEMGGEEALESMLEEVGKSDLARQGQYTFNIF